VSVVAEGDATAGFPSVLESSPSPEVPASGGKKMKKKKRRSAKAKDEV
jgi:hypothetical protein